MGTTTTTFALNKPTVGGDDNAWGTDWNTNADKLDDLLDGTTGITPNLLTGWEVGGVAVTATAAELNILDGVTASAAEINVLDGVTASTAELNILDGVTASTAELNILDGVTLTATELNYVDGVTSAIQTQLDAKYDSGDIASQAEAEAGTDNTKVMTPLRLRNALNATGSAPVYACRAWVNFNGTGTVAIRASGNVSSITDNGSGDYTVNFTTAMSDSNYCANISLGSSGALAATIGTISGVAPTASALRFDARATNTGALTDPVYASVSIFR